MSDENLPQIGEVVHIPEAGEGVECRTCPGWLGYAVGNDGIVWSSKVKGLSRPFGRENCGQWRMLRCWKIKNSRYQVQLYNGDGTRKHKCVHNLVLEAFVGPRPLGMWGCHINDIPTDNRVDNLYWGTPKQNHADSKRNGTNCAGARNGNSIVDETTVAQIKQEYRRLKIDRLQQGKTKLKNGQLLKMADKYGLKVGTIFNIITRAWKHVE